MTATAQTANPTSTEATAMTTLTHPAPWDLPADAVSDIEMLGTYYGVPLSDIGEDGNIVALGHVGKLRMIAAMRRHAREFYGEGCPFAGESVANLADAISHLWMVNTAQSSTDWWLKRAEPGEPGAFPVTYWTAP